MKETIPFDIPHMCADIDEIAKFIRTHVGRDVEGRIETIWALQKIKDGIHKLRINSSYWKEFAAQQGKVLMTEEAFRKKYHLDESQKPVPEDWWGAKG